MLYDTSENFIQDDKQVIQGLKQIVSIIDPKFSSLRIYPGKESQTVDKQNIYLCLKDKLGNYYSTDILLYVLLHEIAHVMSKSYSTNTHNEEFHTNFNNLLRKAYDLQLLDENVNIPQNYCSMEKFNVTGVLIKRVLSKIF